MVAPTNQPTNQASACYSKGDNIDQVDDQIDQGIKCVAFNLSHCVVSGNVHREYNFFTLYTIVLPFTLVQILGL